MSRYTKLSLTGEVLPDAAAIETVGAIRINANGILVAPLLLNKGKRANWAKAKELAAACDFGGHTDWRLPTVEEAFLIPDRTKVDPAIDTDFFPFLAKGGWIWTSTVDASDPESYAWLVFLNGGYGNVSHRSYEGLVLAVRGGSPGQS